MQIVDLYCTQKICSLCLKGTNIINAQYACFENSLKISNSSSDRFAPLIVGDCITSSIPDVKSETLTRRCYCYKNNLNCNF